MHQLTNIDSVAREADCSQCGKRVSIKKRNTTSSGKIIYRCSRREHEREQLRRRPWRRALAKEGEICARCGFEPEDLCQLDIHKHREARDKREVLCANCHRLISKLENLK